MGNINSKNKIENIIIEKKYIITKNKNYYDYIIIGSSPFGLTCAYYLSKINKKVLLIDKNKTLGGSFRIDRQNGLYSEYNNTYYSDSFINFDRLLLKFGTSFKKLFKKTNYNLYDFINSQNFSIAKNNILQILNTEIIHNLYIPKLPNDIKLFKIWEENLDCDIKLDIKYEIIDKNTILIYSDNLNDDIFYRTNHIILDNENIKETNYYNIFYHWNDKIDLNKNIITEINILKINYQIKWNKLSYDNLILSDYMYFNNPESFTVISRKSKNNLDEQKYVPKPTNTIITKCYESDNIETLVVNAINYLYILEPEIKKTVILEDSYNIIDIIKFLLLIKFVLFIFRF